MREWLWKLRGTKTCREFGKELGISEQYYWLIEQGYRQQRMRVILIAKVAEVTGRPVEELVEAEREFYRENH